MAKTARNTIKTWFETGDFPTQEQFWNWLDSFWHKDDQLGISNIDQLTSILAGKATTQETDNLQQQIDNLSTGAAPITITTTGNYQYVIPAGKLLQEIVVLPTADLAGFSVGSTENGSDISPVLPVSASNPDSGTIMMNKYAKTDRSVWFNGITSSTTIKIYLR